MDCLHPIRIKNPNYKIENGFEGNEYCFVPCGRCAACIVSNANEWRVRLQIENDNCESSYFVTLTYDDEKLPIGIYPDSFGDSHVVPYVCKRDVQLFFKRLRKSFPDSKIRYFLVSEYGPTTYRPHYHCILFNLPRFSDNDLLNESKVVKTLQRVWSNGFITVDKVTSGRISYVTKYLSCVTDLPDWFPRPFRLMSRNPGIGQSYLDKNGVVDWHRSELACYYPSFGDKLRLPRYLKDKIFDDDMKAEISEHVQKVRRERFINDVENAALGGYDSVVDFRESTTERFLRKFEKQLKKSRKDV